MNLVHNSITPIKFVPYNYEISKEMLKNSGFSRTKYKELSLNVINEINTYGDLEIMGKVANVVTKWAAFETDKADICECVIAENDSVKDIIILVEDTTKDHVLDYDDFMFDIRHKYDEVHDFMVIDENMKAVIDAMYEKSENIYTRG